MGLNLKKREGIYIGLLLLAFASYLLSFAGLSILMFALIPLFFFVDTRKAIYRKWLRIRSSRVFLAMTLLWVSQVLGALYSTDQIAAWDRVLSMFPLVYLSAIAVSEPLTRDKWKGLVSWVSGLLTALFLALMVFHLFYYQRGLGQFVHFTINQRLGLSQFYLVFVLAIPLITGLGGLKERKWLEGGALVFLSLFNILLLGNRTAILFLLVFGAYYGLRAVQDNWRKGLLLLGAGMVFATMMFSLPWIQKRFEVVKKTTDLDLKTILTKNRFTETHNTLEHRVLIHYVGWNIALLKPLGLGTGDVQEVLVDRYEEIGFKAGYRHRLNAHNQFLQEALKTGILGLSAYLFLVIVLVRGSVQSDLYAQFFVAFFVLGSLAESFLNRQHGVFVLGLLVPLFLRHGRWKKRNT